MTDQYKSLNECINDLERVSRRAGWRPSYDNIKATETTTRDAWAAYLDTWLDNPRSAKKYCSRFYDALVTCAESVDRMSISAIRALTTEEQVRRVRFKQNIGRRLSRLHTLTTEGYDSLIEVLDIQLENN